MSDAAGTKSRVDELLAASAAAEARGDFASAVRSAKEASELAPDDWRAFMLLGNAQSKLGHSTAAIEALNKAVGLKPDDYGPLLTLAVAYAKSANYKPAKTTMLQALDLAAPGATKSEVLTNLGTLQGELGERAEAEASFRKASEEDPQNIEARAKLFMNLVERQEPDSAMVVAYGIADIVKQRPLTPREDQMVTDVGKLNARIRKDYERREAAEQKLRWKEAARTSTLSRWERTRRRLEMWTIRSETGRRLAFLIRPFIRR